MHHAVHIATRGILGGLVTTLGYIIGFSEVVTPLPPEPPVPPIPYVGLGGMGGGGSSAIGRREDDKIIKVLFVYKGEEYEYTGAVNKNVMIMLEDLVLLEVGGKPVVALKEESLRRVDNRVSVVVESLTQV